MGRRIGRFSRSIEGAIDCLDRALVPSEGLPVFGGTGIPIAPDGGLCWFRAGLLGGEARPRYVNVPAEAFPFLDAGVDGCHFALWLDDPRGDEEPCIVFVSPMDGTPETVRFAARNVDDFLGAARRGALEVVGVDDRDPAVLAQRQTALGDRTLRIRYATADGLGVMAPPEPTSECPRPSHESLRSLRSGAPAQLVRFVEESLAASAPGLGLAVCRDLIADLDASGIPGFARCLAATYGRLGRDALAEVALISYGG